MEQNNKIILFQEKQIRRVWKDNEWWFVIEDVVLILTDSANSKNYIRDMRRRDAELSKGWGQIAHTLTVETQGGKQRMNCANTKGIFRLIMSIPSSKAEPFKLWLSEVGYERIEEIENPELAIERAKALYQAKGYSNEWIETRLKSIDIRKQLTDEWQKRGLKEGIEYAILTSEIAKATFDLKGGHAAGTARKSYEKTRNVKVVSSDNFLNLVGRDTIDVPLLDTDDVD